MSKAPERNYNFNTQIDKFVINTKERMLAVTKQALLDTIQEAQTTTSNGGKMRVLTGFLRHTGIASLNKLPYGPSNERDIKKKYIWGGGTVEAVLLSMKLGDVFYFGWTANYAKYREAYDGFLESAVMNWQIHVNNAVNRFRNKDAAK